MPRLSVAGGLRDDRREGDALSEPLRWGVVGTGAIAAVFAEDLARTESGYARAVGSRRLESAQQFAHRFGIPNRHGSYEALVADPEVDAVYVATPASRHHADALLALLAGKPALVEKPFTIDAAEAGDLVSTARARGVFLMEAMWTRFLPHFVEIRGLLARRALGDIVTVSADHGQWFAEELGSRLFAPELGGGALLDLGIYPVSFASMVLGAPDRIASFVEPASTGVDGQTSMIFSYPGGAHALLTCTLRADTPTRAAIIGTDARVEIDGDFYAPSSFMLVPRSGEPTRFAAPTEGRGLWHQADEVARCLREGLAESPVMPLDETVSIMRVMDAVRDPARG